MAFDAFVLAIWAFCWDSTWLQVLAGGFAFWWAAALVKATDDVVDGDNSIGQLASSWPQCYRVALTAGMTVAAVIAVITAASLSDVAAILMLSQAAGCLVAGKIDCWQHAVSMGAIFVSSAFVSTVLQDAWWAWVPLTAAAFVDELLHDLVDGEDDTDKPTELDTDPLSGTKPAAPAASTIRLLWVKLVGGRMVSDAVAVAIFFGAGLGPQLAVLVFAGYEAAETWYPLVISAFGLDATAQGAARDNDEARSDSAPPDTDASCGPVPAADSVTPVDCASS